PPVHQQSELLDPANQMRLVGAQRLEPAVDIAFREHRPGADRRRQPLELGGTELLVVEQSAHQASRGLGDDDHSRLPHPLHPCSRAGRLGVSPTPAVSKAEPDPMRSPTITTPVAMLTLVSSVPVGPATVLRRLTASTIARPARAARSASSSWACG